MRKLTILLVLTSTVVALQSGLALAVSVTFTVRGTIAAARPSGDAWYLRDATGRVVGTAAFACLQPNSRCAWNFRFESGSFDIKVRRRETASRVALTAGIVDAAGDLAHDTGRVRIYFLTPKAATFTFHLKELTGAAAAQSRALAVLITIQHPIRHGLDWQVLGHDGKVLGSATEVSNSRGTVWAFNFRLRHGSIRMIWDFARVKGAVLRRAQITGGRGQYAGATGYASVGALGPGGTVSPNLSGAQSIQVVFHLE